jgi:hypothetical protein
LKIAENLAYALKIQQLAHFSFSETFANENFSTVGREWGIFAQLHPILGTESGV